MMKYIPKPNERQKEWLSRSMTAFIHFGMNTFTSNEWGNGTDNPSLFNPSELDTRQWARVLSESGFDCAILTAKHHDGFCLWPSKMTDYTIAASPYKDGKGDIVREFVDACREYGLRVGIYLSPWDRHESTWGTDAYDDFYVAQLTELLTDYGTIHEVWWDGAGSKDAIYDWERWGNTVRTLAPEAVIFGSRGATPFVDVRWVGNEKGVAGIPCYATLKTSSLLDEVAAELNVGDKEGELFVPAEVDVSIRPGWFYKAEQDAFVRSPENLFQLYLTSVGRGAGLLLNIPPDKRGLFHERDVASLLLFHDFLKENTKEDFATQATKITKEETGENTFHLTYDFHEPITLNTIYIDENLTEGQRCFGIEVVAKTEGIWKPLFTYPCIGSHLIRQFDDILAQEIQIRITDAIAPVDLSRISFYHFDMFDEDVEELPDGYNLLQNPSAKAIRDGNTFDIDLGGVYPFNYFHMEGVDLKSFRLFVFNGSSYDLFYEGKTYYDAPAVYHFPKTIDYAYRLRVEVEEARHNTLFNRKIEILHIKNK